MFHGSSRNWHHHHSTRWHLSIISEVFPLFIETLRSDPWQFSLLNHEEYRHRVIPLYRLFFLWIYMDISHLIPIGIIPNKWRWTYPPSILLDSGHSRNPAPAILDETCWNPKKPWKTHQLQDFAGPSTHIHTTMFFLQAARNVRRTTTLCWDASCSWANAREIRDFPGILRLNFKHFSYWI